MPEYWARRAFRVLATPVGLALIAAVRLLIISNYNVTTAVTVAESGGFVNTFLGSLIPLVPVLMPYLALVFLAFRRFILCAFAIVATALISPVVRPSVVTLSYLDYYWFAIYGDLRSALPDIVFVIVLCGVLVAWGGSLGEVVGYSLFTIIWACVAVFALAPYLLTAYPAPRTQSFYASYIREPWLTAEQITVDPGKIYQGYVLSSDDQWMTVLLYQSRTITYFRADSVTARIVCAPPVKPPPPPLVRLVDAKSAPLPECRNSDSWAATQPEASSAATKTQINSPKTVAPIQGAEGKVVSPPKRPACCKADRHGSHKTPPPHRPHKIVRPPTPPTRFHHRHRLVTSGGRSTHRAGGSPRSLQPSHTEALSGELFLLWAAYRDKSFGELA
jgi:hypothetical protein